MDVMGIEMVEGRNFNQYDSAGVTVVTRYMMDQFGIMPGDILPEAGEVIGICENVRFNSVREPNTPIAFIPSGIYSGVNGVLYFRITAGSNAFQAVSDIESLIREADPYWPSQVEFYDTIQNNLYQNEIRTSRLVVAFSVIAAILALCGVIGLVLFDTEYRRKETAVRKIFGASVASILERANIGYGTIVGRDHLALAAELRRPRPYQPLGLCPCPRGRISRHCTDRHRRLLPPGHRQSPRRT